jgi:alkanesulfonate monooxygenase SsuD/methylene tetrahydromethanopterin reductase-like flavin-dependent oxidoreductase (luciferase family)
LCLFENPSNEAGRALIRQFVLVREADRMGYDDIWLTEHHGDASRPSGAITALLGHLAGVTSKARIGAVLQAALRDSAQLAEDLATVELLSRGRLALAVDALAGEVAGAPDRLADLRARLLGESADLVPRPVGASLPGWVLASHADAVRGAAQRALGLWLPPDLATETVPDIIALYRKAALEFGTAPEPKLLLTRYASPAAAAGDARQIATTYLEAMAGAGRRESLLRQSLVGTHAEVAARIRQMEAEFGLHGVVVIPMSANFDVAKHILADMVDEVRPLLDD